MCPFRPEALAQKHYQCFVSLRLAYKERETVLERFSGPTSCGKMRRDESAPQPSSRNTPDFIWGMLRLRLKGIGRAKEFAEVPPCSGDAVSVTSSQGKLTFFFGPLV
jgi:hypothetical protein